MTLRIDHGVVSGTFSLDGETFDVENNIWVLGDDAECLVIDAPHDVDALLEVVAGRKVVAVVCTHGHDDHVRVAPELAQRVDAPVLLHPDDLPVWHLTHPETLPNLPLADGQTLQVAGHDVRVIHTPGHAPGGVCLYVPSRGVLFSGDTLFQGGPGATGRSFSSREMLEDSIRTRLFTLPNDTVVHTGHGESTTIGAEADALGR
ncbi:MBL fold metallo-hydrolase [Luteococcus sp. H138]|uniref:MBL fold metallo-hydrolase n=1 Tax=unclassified Luteococcus TaxID=2639923 RepID=UPI00313AEB03